MAAVKVETVGENRLEWINCRRPLMVPVGLCMAQAWDECSVSRGGESGSLGLRSTSHKPGVERCPVKMGLPFWRIFIDVAVKTASQPASQSWPIESSECANDGNTCARLASWGRVGRASVVVWVLDMCEPSGSWTDMGVCVGRWGVPLELVGWKKWPVVPVSAIAVVGDVSMEKPGGGDSGGEMLCAECKLVIVT